VMFVLVKFMSDIRNTGNVTQRCGVEGREVTMLGAP
jgi:hypothetical protein